MHTPSPTLRRAFWRGVAASTPMIIVVFPFGLLFGVVAVDAGLSMLELMAFSIVVIAGAAQFAALQLMQDGAPLIIVVATALAVNLRMAMYSAALTPHLGRASVWARALISYCLVDQCYIAASAEYAKRPDQPLSQKVAFFFGAAVPVCPLWYLATWVGAVFGKAIPPEYALDFAVPIAFLAMVAPMLRTLAHVVAAVTSVALALALSGLPYNSGLLFAAVGAMCAGAMVETWSERRARA